MSRHPRNTADRQQHTIARGLPLDGTDAHGHTAVILAARRGATISIRILAGLGANLEVSKRQYCVDCLSNVLITWTMLSDVLPTQRGSSCCPSDVISTGIMAVSDPQVRSHGGMTAVLHAAFHGKTDALVVR